MKATHADLKSSESFKSNLEGKMFYKVKSLPAVAIVLALFLLLPVVCQAGIFPDGNKTEQIANPMELTVLIPDDKEIKFTALQEILTNNNSYNNFIVERHNGQGQSGKIYTVGYTVEKGKDAMVYKFKALSFKTYQHGLILPFPVPEFTEQDLLKYIVQQPVKLNLELNSPYNAESTSANFMRLTQPERFPGEMDPVPNKGRCKLATKYSKVTFSWATYPYRNGSKVVIHLTIPGAFTSGNTVDFGEIIKEIKGQLEGIVNS